MDTLTRLAADLSLGETIAAAVVALYAIPAFAVVLMSGLYGR